MCQAQLTKDLIMHLTRIILTLKLIEQSGKIRSMGWAEQETMYLYQIPRSLDE